MRIRVGMKLGIEIFSEQEILIFWLARPTLKGVSADRKSPVPHQALQHNENIAPLGRLILDLEHSLSAEPGEVNLRVQSCAKQIQKLNRIWTDWLP